jgi:hypothetical protein
MNNKKEKKNPSEQNFLRSFSLVLLLLLVMMFIGNSLSVKLNVKLLEYGEFYRLVESNPQASTIKVAKKIENVIEGEFTPQGIEKA